MRRTGLDIKSIVIALIIINVVIFFLTQFNYFPTSGKFVNNLISKGKPAVALEIKRHGIFISLFSLFPLMIMEMGWIWQFLTYMFLHGSIFHLFFNMYALLLFGRPLEERWGLKEFLAFYLVTGVGAGIVTFLWNLASNPFIPTIGASGAIFGLVLAFGLEFPETVLLLFFIIPIKARYAALIFGGIELVMIITGSMQGIGHFTHLAGLFFGFIYYLIRIRGRSRFRRKMFSHSIKSYIDKRKTTTLIAKKDRIVQNVQNISDKLKRGNTLSNAENALLIQLKTAYEKNKNVICAEEEFSGSSDFCKKCDDFYACLYRFLIRQLQ